MLKRGKGGWRLGKGQVGDGVVVMVGGGDGGLGGEGVSRLEEQALNNCGYLYSSFRQHI